jgi:uncharacterized PurR-regulated membrane protein YhhQ (DUF165 family)
VIWLIGFLLTIPAANWTLQRFGVLDVGGLAVPAGVLWIGLAFTLRDLAHDRLGPWWVLGAIAAGAALSYAIAPAFALASGAAFLLSELTDFAVYAPLRRRSFLGAVLASNSVGLVWDSALFLWLAFGSLAFLPGQLVGKGLMTALALGVLWLYRTWRATDAAYAEVAGEW